MFPPYFILQIIYKAICVVYNIIYVITCHGTILTVDIDSLSLPAFRQCIQFMPGKTFTIIPNHSTHYIIVYIYKVTVKLLLLLLRPQLRDSICTYLCMSTMLHSMLTGYLPFKTIILVNIAQYNIVLESQFHHSFESKSYNFS